jgi:ankyrin repeat protein
MIKLITVIFLFILGIVCSSSEAVTTTEQQADGLAKLQKRDIPFTDVSFYSYVNKDDAAVVLEFLNAGYDVNKHNEASQVSIIKAAEKGSDKVAELLLLRGADANATDVEGSTALMYAAYNKHSKMVTLLIDFGADVNMQNKDGWTALMFAIEGGDKKTIDNLVTIKTDLTLKNKDNKAVRDLARKHDFDKLPQYMLDKIAFLKNQEQIKQHKLHKESN